MSNLPEVSHRFPGLFFIISVSVAGTYLFVPNQGLIAQETATTAATIKSSASNVASPNLVGLQKEVSELAESLEEKTARHRLIAIDYELSESRSPAISKLREQTLRLLAKSADPDAIQYIRTVFETDTEHRDEAAFALSEYALLKPSNLHIWRFLIRSLTVVEGEQAVSVMKALKRYRQKATNPRWVRRVILVGLRLPENDLPAVLQLLEHWTNAGVVQATAKKAEPKEKKEGASNKKNLAQYQNWFRKKWPNELDPSWTELPENSRWTYNDLHKRTTPLVFTKENVNRGKQIFVKANCVKCHRKGDVGKKFGPNLSDIAGLRQRKEILEAILFPSLELNEDFPTVTVLVDSGRTYSGLMSAGKEGTIEIIRHDGEKSNIQREKIESIVPAKKSNMLAGTLESLTLQEICDLLAYIEHRANPKRPFHKPAQ